MSITVSMCIFPNSNKGIPRYVLYSVISVTNWYIPQGHSYSSPRCKALDEIQKHSNASKIF